MILPTLIKMMQWSQNQLKADISYPEITSLYPLKYLKPEQNMSINK